MEARRTHAWILDGPLRASRRATGPRVGIFRTVPAVLDDMDQGTAAGGGRLPGVATAVGGVRPSSVAALSGGSRS
jgi:hypothetical protein